MAEYRELRKKVAFLELCGDPDLALQVTLQPVDRFGVDAAIVFSDILPVLEAIGRTIEFAKGMGPIVHDPVRDAAGAASLVRPDVSDALWVLPETLRRFRKLRPETPILGFAGAPFTLLCYLVEGGSSKSWQHTKSLLWSDPPTARRLLDLLADVVGDYLQSQVDAGAAAVQMFDTWAGILGPEDYRRWALPSANRALARVKGAPRIYYSRDASILLPMLRDVDADVYSLDWRVDMAKAREVLGDVPVQGNLDPVALFAPEAEIRRRVRRIIAEAGPLGHVFNLGHGVLPETPIAGVEAMLDEVKRTRYADAV
jgi:uroporphyrinogen decarboxylase